MATIAAREPARAPGVLSTILLAIILAVVLSVAILAAEERAIYAVLGVIVFFFVVRNPVWGLYLTTALLLLAGISASYAGVRIGIPSAGAKAAGVATIAAWLANTLATGKRFMFTWDILLVLAFAGWSLVGISLSLIWREQLPEWVRLINAAAYFVLAVHLLDSREKFRAFAFLVVGCGAAMSAFAVLQYVTPALQFSGVGGIEGIGSGTDMAYVDPEGLTEGAAVRVTGGTGHSNWLAFALLLILPLNVYCLVAVKSWRARAILTAAILIQLAALILTFTRLGFLVGIVVGLVVVLKRLVKLTPHRAAALAVAVVLAWFVLPEAYKERVINFATYARSESTAARVELQHFAWQYMQEYPIAGIGLGGFGPRFHEEHTAIASMLRWLVKYKGWNAIYYGCHNFYLQLGSETGVIGLVLMLLLFARGLYNAQRARNLFLKKGDRDMAVLSGAVWVSVLAFLLCALFLHALHQKIWWMVFAVAAALPALAMQAAPSTSGGRLPGVNPVPPEGTEQPAR